MSDIVSIRIKNFLGISDVEIKPGHINQITGRNGQGKTSILKALGIAAEGSTDGAMVRNGEEAAEILVELSDDTKIRRRIHNTGRQSTMVTKGDFEVKAPQSYLDQLFDSAAFNPIELLDPKKRNEAILSAINLRVTADDIAAALDMKPEELPPVNFDQHGLKVIDDVHKYMYQRRAEANKDAIDKEVRFKVKSAELVNHEQPLMSWDDLEREAVRWNATMTKITKNKKEQELAIKQSLKVEEEIKRAEATVIALDAELDSMGAELEKKIDELRLRYSERSQNIDGRKHEIFASIARLKSMPEPEIQDFEQLEEVMRRERFALDIAKKELETYEAQQAQKRAVDELQSICMTAKMFAQSLDYKVRSLAGPIKQKLMSSVQMPVKGLEYRDGEFLLNDVRVENLSTSESMRLAVAIARAHAKKVKIICIDGLEALDEQTWRAFLDETKDDGFTYFVSKVGDPLPGSPAIIMSNGKIERTLQ